MTKAWTTMKHVFSVGRRQGDTFHSDAGPQLGIGPHQNHTKLLKANPVDILVVEHKDTFVNQNDARRLVHGKI